MRDTSDRPHHAMKILVVDESGARREATFSREEARATARAPDDGLPVFVLVVPGTLPAAPSAPAPARESRQPSRLTPRQAHVLAQLVRGSSNKEIGRALAISEKTVKVHLSAIFRALRVMNRTQAALAAGREGLLDQAFPGPSA